MRAMAHPLRLRIVGSLRIDGPATASLLARRLSTDSGQTSHHLRTLARAGFIVEAPDLGKGPRGRERWWRAAQESTSWDDLTSTGPEGALAVQVLETAVRHVWDEMLSEYQTQSRTGFWSAAWVNAASSGDYPIHTTAAGLEALTAELLEVIARHDQGRPGSPTEPGGQDNAHDADQRAGHQPAGEPASEPAESVVVLIHAFPRRAPS